MRLIDADAIPYNYTNERGVPMTREIDIQNMPTIEKRKTGQWIDEGFYADGHGAHAFRCSECGGHIIEYDADPFCRWCGAKMEIEESEEADLDYERAVMEHQHNMLYEPTFNPEDGSM